MRPMVRGRRGGGKRRTGFCALRAASSATAAGASENEKSVRNRTHFRAYPTVPSPYPLSLRDYSREPGSGGLLASKKIFLVLVLQKQKCVFSQSSDLPIFL